MYVKHSRIFATTNPPHFMPKKELEAVETGSLVGGELLTDNPESLQNSPTFTLCGTHTRTLMNCDLDTAGPTALGNSLDGEEVDFQL